MISMSDANHPPPEGLMEVEEDNREGDHDVETDAATGKFSLAQETLGIESLEGMDGIVLGEGQEDA